jgi:hypothetical protein
MVTMASASFSGIYGGFWLQEYWYYRDVPVYYDVDPFTASLDMYQSGKYYLTPGSYVAVGYAGYFDYTDRDKPTKYVCVSPIFNGSGIDPLPKPVNIQFWALGADDCCSNFGATGQTCSQNQGRLRTNSH